MNATCVLYCPSMMRGWCEVKIWARDAIIFLIFVMEIGREFLGSNPSSPKLTLFIILTQYIKAMFKINNILREFKPILFFFKIVIYSWSMIFNTILIFLLNLIKCIFSVKIWLLLYNHDLIFQLGPLINIPCSLDRHSLGLLEKLWVKFE